MTMRQNERSLPAEPAASKNHSEIINISDIELFYQMSRRKTRLHTSFRSFQTLESNHQDGNGCKVWKRLSHIIIIIIITFSHLWSPAPQNSRSFLSNGTLGVRDGVDVSVRARVKVGHGRGASVAVVMSVRVTVRGRAGVGVGVEVSLILSVAQPAFGQTVLVVEQRGGLIWTVLFGHRQR